MRFIAILKNGKRAGQIELTASEYSMADCMWTQTIQASSFRLKLLRLNSGESPIYLKELMLYLDEKPGELITLHYPVLLKPLYYYHHFFTELLNKERQKMVHYDGIRETHWIPRGRETVKRVVWGCVISRTFEGKPYSPPLMPDLPPERVSEVPPFVTTGVDFAGPLYVKSHVTAETNDKVKAYICLFICAST